MKVWTEGRVKQMTWLAAGAFAVFIVGAAAIHPFDAGDPPQTAAEARRPAQPSAGDALSAQAQSAVVLAAGDIASCGSAGDEATALVLDAQPDGLVVTLGDNVYDNGTATEFASCYAPSWGRHRGRTRPSAGNHDYNTTDAAGYYAYFGAAAADPTEGYYSFDVGEWHLIAINSNCGEVGGCGAGSPQEQWLRDDLAARPKACTLAYWHHPRFSSSSNHGNTPAMQPIWQALYDYGAEIVLSGHDHTYERFAPQTPGGAADASGIREFVVGTGGRSHYGFDPPEPNSEVRNGDTYGVLRLTLGATSYSWQFLPEAGKTFTDSGSGLCHSVDSDVDGHVDEADNCPTVANALQADGDADSVGDTCEAPVYGTDAAIADSDGDGCADGAELWNGELAGGWRSPTDRYDFFDVTNDSAVDLQDTLLVLAHFGDGPNTDALDDSLDRRIPKAWEPWRTASDNSGVDLADALNNLRSFGHVCAG